MNEDGGIKEIIPILFLTIVVCISVALLTLTNSITIDKREEQEKLEIQNKLEDIFPGMFNYTEDEKLDVYLINDENSQIGIAFIVEGKGYGGVIKMLMGLDMNLTDINGTDDETNIPIKGMKIIPPISETPGLGAKIEEDWFQDQFSNITVGDLKMGQGSGGGERQFKVIWYSLFVWEIESDDEVATTGVDGITGATISSKGVVNSLEETALAKIESIKNKMGGGV